jgi:NADPH:quinone reductase-like Zn-dependent oxidoreductase
MSGDEVMGDIASYGFGGFAEYVAVPEDALIKKPSKISFSVAATLPMAGMTALQALRDLGKISKGEKVLIVGSSGGVGTFAVQLARFFEAEVTGVCSTRKIQQTLSLGADYAIDYTKEYFPESGRQYNLILAINGNYPIIACKRVLTPDGIYVMVGGSLWQIFNAIMFGRVLSIGTRKMRTLAAKANINDLEFLTKLLENGIIKPVIDRRYTLDRSADAMRYVSEGHSHGKVLIIVVPE